jgi:hypothetical protein
LCWYAELTIGGAVKVDVTVEVGSTFLREQALESPDTAGAGAIAEASGPISSTDVMIALATADTAAKLAARGTIDAGVTAAASVTVIVVIIRVVCKIVLVLEALVVKVLNVEVSKGNEQRALNVHGRGIIDHFSGWWHTKPDVAERLDISRMYSMFVI